MGCMYEKVYRLNYEHTYCHEVGGIKILVGESNQDAGLAYRAVS